MLRRDELRWLPWAPLLLVEGLYARLATARLPPAGGARGATGSGPVVRLAGLGDSIIAGIGVATQREGLVGQAAAACAERASVRVEWQAVGASGATSREVLQRLLPVAKGFEPQLVVLSVGVNDAVAGVEPAAFKRNLKAIVDTLAAPRGGGPAIVFGGIPPLETFPALPWPLSRLLGARAHGLQRAAVELTGYRGLRVVVFPERLEPAGFARDGFHPGPDGCRAWASWVADGFALALDDLSGRTG
jgi:lysophospholipase L1-like esterase